MKPNSGHGWRGFTLIELLVVVAIISLLIAILTPSLTAARDQARTLQCLTFQRQYGVAAQMYGQEYDQYIRGWVLTTNPETGWYWARHLAVYLGSPTAWTPPLTQDRRRAVAQTLERFECPAIDDIYGYPVDNLVPSAKMKYTVNGYLDPTINSRVMNGPNRKAVTFNDIRYPSQTTYIADGWARYAEMSGQYSDTYPPPSVISAGVLWEYRIYTAHRGAFNALYLDAHAETLYAPLPLRQINPWDH